MATNVNKTNQIVEYEIRKRVGTFDAMAISHPTVEVYLTSINFKVYQNEIIK
jgi:hypothetical protein